MRFPLEDVKIEISPDKREVENPVYNNGFFCANQKEVAVDVERVARYHSKGGNEICITPYNGAEKKIMEHFLNSWGLVCILHQRKILNFHASSLEINGKGVMICGDSGAGKSSLVAALSLKGAEILSDDITPVVFQNHIPAIKKLANELALKNQTLEQLQNWKAVPDGINPFNEKKLFRLKGENGREVPLLHILWLHMSNHKEIGYSEVNGIQKFSMLRGEICGWEMLQGMRETESEYMKQLADISRIVRIAKVDRPLNYSVIKLGEMVYKWLKATV